ncbi:putative quinol monooxygenase [Jannaschia sp. CCS1]|uniref:putative quinol monooxygenase n=1 Tax=Jannaschia sp. (strain CCS1) TaxID=290400 RepID=UPI000053DE3E|nr:antibiotic biosynthesis monooxygenase [Jannaschia sp. CCS1]ABD54212.1 Antibiotic biosynthesis monooxygenase [Jannaschia sp. CCS1]
MKLITVEADFATADLDAAVALFSKQANAVRAMAGCAHYALFRRPSEDGVAILQHWETLDQFDSYRASETFATLGAGLRPLMTKPPMTIVAEVDTV